MQFHIGRGSLFVCALVLCTAPAAHAASTLYGVAPFFSGTTLYAFNTTTGAATPVGPTGTSSLIGVTADNNGRLLALSFNGELVSLDPLTGAGTRLASLAPGSFYEGDIAVDPTTNVAYIVEEHRFFKLDLATNAVTLAGSATYNNATMRSETNIDGLAFRGGDLYGFVTIQTPGLNGHLIRIDKDTLAVTDVGDTGLTLGGTAGLAYDAAADVFYVGGSGSAALYRVDPRTGAATLVGNHGLSELSGLTTLVPEPSSVALLLVGMLVAAGRRRRRRAA